MYISESYHDLPKPFVPLDCDLRDYLFVPYEHGRLFSSTFHAHANDSEWRAGITLHLKSYQQVPAGSLPSNDVELARLAEFGRDVESWRNIGAFALHGWIKCSDGRLYHPVMCEKALEGWVQKIGQRKSSASGNASKHKRSFDPAPYDQRFRRRLSSCVT